MRYPKLTELVGAAAPDSRCCILPRAVAKLTDSLGWGTGERGDGEARQRRSRAPSAVTPRRHCCFCTGGENGEWEATALYWTGACHALGPHGRREQRKESGCDVLMVFSSCFPSLPSLAGVNSFMVYMAYKDLYQVSNTEVTSHCCVVWGSWMGFPLLPMTLALGA